jgi:hypothetical protein
MEGAFEGRCGRLKKWTRLATNSEESNTAG